MIDVHFADAINRTLAAIPAIVAAVGATFALGILTYFVSSSDVTPRVDKQYIDQVEQLSAEAKSMQTKINVLDEKVKSMLKAVDDAIQHPETLELSNMDAALQKTSKDIEAIQKALGSDIEKALSVPLMRKDLDQINSKLTENEAATSKDIDRIYDQTKWFLGLMATMAIGILGLAISNFFQIRREQPRKLPPKKPQNKPTASG